MMIELVYPSIEPFTEGNRRYHYGWARISIPTNGCELLGYAYETEPNKAIGAGQKYETKASGFPPVELPRSNPMLGLLARGADGLAMWRREETHL